MKETTSNIGFLTFPEKLLWTKSLLMEEISKWILEEVAISWICGLS